jgi:diguanylate cyclase (GGDEF)-like protein/PAS domain S-box-containing protein
MKGIAHLWDFLVGAPPVDGEHHARRLLPSILLVLIPLGALSALLQLWWVPGFRSTFMVAGLVLLIIAYLLARRGYTLAGILLTVAVALGGGYATVFINPADMHVYPYLAISTLLAAVFFRERGAMALGALHVAMLAAVLPAAGVMLPGETRIVMPVFHAMLAALLYLALRAMRTLEAVRHRRLAESEARFRAFFHASPVVMGLSRLADGRYLDVNRGFEDWTGWSRDEAIGRTSLELNLWETPNDRLRLVQELERGGRLRNAELRIRTRDGQLREVLASIDIVDYNHEPCLLVSVVDITARKQAEQGTRRLNRLLQTLGAINPALVGAESEPQLFANICRTLVEQGGFAMAWVGLAEPATRRVQVACQAGFAHGYLESLDIRYDDSPQGQGPTGAAIRSGRTVVNDDTETNPQFVPWRERARQSGYRSTVAVPLRVRGQVVGSLNVYAAAPRAFGHDEVVLLEKLAGDVGMAIERLRAEQALRDSEARYRNIVETAQEGIWQIDADSRTLFVNRTMARILGYTVAEMQGRPLFDFMDDDGRAIAARNVERRKQGIAEQHEFRFRHKDGSEVWVEMTTTPLLDDQGRYTGALAMVTDITERRRADQALRASELLLAHSQEVAHLGSFEWNLRTNEVVWSRETYRLFGEDPDHPPADIWALLARAIHPEDQPRLQANMSRVAEQGIREPMELRVLWADGSEHVLWSEGDVLVGADGRPERMVGTMQDITARKRAEQALAVSESNYRALTENANVGILVNHRGRHVYANRQLLEWLGYTEAEIRRTGVRELVHPDEYEKVMARFNDRMAGQPVATTYETVFVAKDGTPIPMEIAATRTVWEGEPAGLVFLHDIRERKRLDQALRDSEARFRTLSEVAFEGIFIHDQGRIVDCNPTFAAMLGYRPEEIHNLTVFDLVMPAEQELVRRSMHEGYDIPLELTAVRKDGSTFPIEVYGKPLNYRGRAMRVATMRDISARLRSEAEMRKLSSAMSQTADAVLIADRDGIIEYVNPAFEAMTGYSRDELIGGKPGIIKSGKQGDTFYRNLWDTILAGNPFSDVFVNRRKDGSLYYEEKTITPLKDGSGRITHFVATGRDITERMQTQERLQFLAQHDALTELPNRALFLDRLRQSLARARWHQRLVAVLFIDLDRFKTINDTLGHDIGDRLLQQLGERFSRSVREGDTVARFGGDEFVILLDDVASDKDVGQVAQKVLDALAGPFAIEGQSLYITASIGVSLFPGDGEDTGTLLKHADIAMYRAKELGKNTYQFYSADMSARAFERLSLETSLRHALERGEFRLHYQPQLDTDSGRIVAFEALLRWQHPDFGLVAPAEFIPMLEETGLIIPVGDWVLGAACGQLQQWRAAGWADLHMAVNLSPRQFQSSGVMASVETGIARLGCKSGLLELEITEGMLLQHAGATLETLGALREVGVRLAIDDFGTGYSSLSYLRRFPIDTLKIDRSFVHDIPHDPDDSAIVTAIAALARSLKLEMVAEGVETEAQRDFLRSLGCIVMQGYLFSRPLPADDVTRLLEQHNPR